MFSQINKKNTLAVFVIFLFGFFVFQFSAKSQNKFSDFDLTSPSETPHYLVGTFYDVQNFSGKFLLNNKGVEPITIYPTLYNLDGQSFQVAPEIIDANSHRLIDLTNWTNQGGENFKQGNIKIFHTGKDLVLGTQIYLEDKTNSISFDEKLAELTKFDTRQQEAVWWMPDRNTDVKIILSNTSDESISINAMLSRKPKKVGVTESFSLQPHETKVLDLRNDFSDGSQFDSHEVLGLSLSHAGAKDSLLARIMLKNQAIGYSNVVQFSNPGTGKSNEYQGVGFHIDKMGETQLEPIIVVKNVGTVDSNVSIKIPYNRNNGITNTINLPTENLKAGEMRLVNANPIKQIALAENIKTAGIEVRYDSPNGSVIVATHSISPDKTQTYRVPMWDPFQQKTPTGGYPWRIEETSTTKTYIKNITDEEQEYLGSIIWENGGHYKLGVKKIKPHQTIEIDVKQLRDEQIPDFSGATIPFNITRGQIRWSLHQHRIPENSRDRLALIGRSEQIDIINGMSSNYACQNCCGGGQTDSFISTNSTGTPRPVSNEYEFEYGDTIQYYAFIIHKNCYGEEEGFCSIPAKSWSSSNSSVATVSSSGLVSIASAGNVAITADLDGFFNIEPIGCAFQFRFLPNENDGEKGCQTKEEYQSLLPGCDECGTQFVNLDRTANIASKPKVTIADFDAVGKNKTANIGVTVSGNSNNVPITLTLSQNAGTTGEARFTATNTTTRTITQTTNVEVKGITESSTEDNMRFRASYNGKNYGDGEKFSVVSVSLQLRTSGTVSNDNSGRIEYNNLMTNYNLGQVLVVNEVGNPKKWGYGVEIVGTVLPNDYEGLIVLQRFIINACEYINQTESGCFSNQPDPSLEELRDDNPQSGNSNGKVFDLDAPRTGILNLSANQIRRVRVNFKQYATIGNSIVSEDLNWFARISVVNNGSTNGSIINDVSNDNTTGTGSTLTSWNLQ